MFMTSLFKIIENKYHVYRGEDYAGKFCESLREHALEVINFTGKKMKLLTKEQQESFGSAKIYCICEEKFENKYVKDKKNYNVRDNCLYTWYYRGVGHIICNVRYSVPLITFHNWSSYDYDLVIKALGGNFHKKITF